MRKAWLILAGSLVAIVAAVVGIRGCDETPENVTSNIDLGAPDAGIASVDIGPDVATQAWLVPQPADGEFAALVDGAAVQAQFVIGAAGVYPPLETAGMHIALPVPAATMNGTKLTSVEVYARTDDGAHAFWGEVGIHEASVELAPAQSATVRVIDEGGTPRPGATVRLARGAVGLVLLHAKTDEAGEATFAALPPGEFTVMAELRGATVAPGVVEAGAEVMLVATEGHEVLGVVTDPDGRPVANAVVAVHGAALDGDPVEQIPADIVKTDSRGEYRATGVPGSQLAVVALAPGFPPATVRGVPSDGPTRLDVRLQPGQRVVALVTSDGAPVKGARVEWRDAGTHTGMTKLSDEEGRVKFDGVPLSAEMFAQFNHFESGRVQLRTLPAAPTIEVALALESTDARIWRYRIEAPDGVTLSSLQLHDSAGVSCHLSTDDGRDYVARGCGDGEANFESRTNFGAVEWSAGNFVDGKTVEVPEPTSLEVQITGAVDEQWEATTFTLVGSAPIAVDPEVSPLPGGQRLTATVYPGRWELTVSNPRIGTMPFVLNVGDEPLSTEIELVALHRFSLRVVDRFGAGVTGAYAMLFDDSGALVDISRSAGQLPVEFRVRPPFNGELLVVDPRRGEGRVTLQSSGEAPERVDLNRQVLTHSTPASRSDRTAFEKATGATLVERDNGWVLDFAGDTAGTRAGLERGDWLVTAWKQRGQWRVIVKRAAAFVDVSL